MLTFTVMAENTVAINPTGRDFTLISLLRLSDSVIGEVEATITKDQQILLPAKPTLLLLSDTFTEETLNRLSALQMDEKISNQSFSQLNIDLTFEMSSLELIITAPSDTLKIGQINFSSSSNSREFISPSSINGYVNLSALASRTEANSPESTITESYNYTLDASLNIKHAVLEYESIYNDLNGSQAYYSRQGTRLYYDIPEQGTRITIGDFYNNGADFQDSGDMLGFALSRDFATIPTRNVRPTATQQFTLQRTSTVDVVVDGVVIRRLTLPAGSYNLQDIPLTEGITNLELVITDNNGKEERINFSIATGMDLLQEGEFEYNFNGGIESNVSSSEPEYNSDKYIINGEIEYGINSSFTFGGNFQASNNTYQMGQRSLFATALGIFDLKTTYSVHELLDDGVAASLGYDFISEDNQDQKFEFSAYYNYYSKSFTGVRADIDEYTELPLNTNEHYFTSNVSYSFNPYLKILLNGNYVHTYDTDDRYWTISPALSGSIFDTGATWSIRGTHKQYLSNEKEFTGLMSLSWPIGTTANIISRYTTEDNEISTEYSYRNNVGNSGGVNMYIGATHSENSDIDASAGIDYDANRFSFSAEHGSRFTDFSNDTNEHLTQAQLSTGIAFSGTQFAFGRPVGESFAIIRQHKSIAKNYTEISPSNTGARMHSDIFGAMLVPDLAAYSEQILTYDVEDLPSGYDLGAGIFPINPGYGQGYNLQIGSNASITLIGSLMDATSKEPISLISGKAILLGREDVEPLVFFTNRTGRFAITGMRPGTYQLKLNTPKPRFYEIIVDEDSSSLLRLGEIYVD